MKADWTNASQEDVAAIKQWFDDWGGMVANERFEDARELFDPAAIGFGTWMDLVEGLDQLEAKQWRSIWGTISGFRHETTKTLKVIVSPDRLMASGLVTWTSIGFHEDGDQYERPGRTTSIFVRGTLRKDGDLYIPMFRFLGVCLRGAFLEIKQLQGCSA